MSQTSLRCSCCGYLLNFDEDHAVLDCPACGTRNARPKLTGETLLTLQRATEQRLACDFHNAELSYQQVLLYRPDAHEALWGRLLCHYGVEYVEDPATKRRMPTVHTVQTKPLQAQPDFVKACKLAPEAIRAQYELDAVYIDDAQAGIRQKAKPQPQPGTEDMKYSVTISFPGPRPQWTEKPEWYVVSADKKTVLADVEWGGTVTVPIEAERTQVFCVKGKPDYEAMEKAKKRDKVTTIMVFIVFAMVIVGFVQSLMNMNEVPWMLILGLVCVIPVGFVRSAAFDAVTITVKTSQGAILTGSMALAPISGIKVTAGKHYDLSWPKLKTNTDFKVTER